MKKVWKTPQLIVLTRNKPEEAVLQLCKNNAINPGGPGQGGIGCQSNPGGTQWCRTPGQT